jgi:L-ascorbate 6-phosphate lactonase
LALWALGGAGFAIKASETLIYLDPYFGGSFNEQLLRLIATPIDPTQIKTAHAVLSTHSHDDHCEQQTLTAFAANTQAFFVGPTSSAKKMRQWGIQDERIKVLEPGQDCQIEEVAIRALPASDPAEETALTYLLQAHGVTLFHSGDSLYSPIYSQIARQWRIDIALLNLGKEIYMGVDEIVQAASDLQTKVLIPMHWDLWKPYTLCPTLVAQEVKRRKLAIQTQILLLGDKFVYPGE